ncbi:hypothetical protein E2C01_094388 [Portunus trituberculatus]|uniref:Uncharacterized protein n=1 Tax=Portunus trituberculatus TaxID=210409 RepID=A0A5B7JXG0_PORTR|nr:hypothetical protein [Portunus trituberculatus]
MFWHYERVELEGTCKTACDIRWRGPHRTKCQKENDDKAEVFNPQANVATNSDEDKEPNQQVKREENR